MGIPAKDRPCFINDATVPTELSLEQGHELITWNMEIFLEQTHETGHRAPAEVPLK